MGRVKIAVVVPVRWRRQSRSGALPSPGNQDRGSENQGALAPVREPIPSLVSGAT